MGLNYVFLVELESIAIERGKNANETRNRSEITRSMGQKTLSQQMTHVRKCTFMQI